jgi:hypothetical protein
MTGPEHILCWIESSQPHYRRLQGMKPGEFLSDVGRSLACLNLAISAYSEMVKGGDAYKSDHDASTILGAALLIAEWKEPT